MTTKRWPLCIVAAFAVACLALAQSSDESVPKVTEPPMKTNLPPESFTQPVPESEGVTLEMVYLPGGTFRMGSPEGESGHRPEEGPQRDVAVRPFWMAKTEITWQQYAAYQRDMKLFMYDIEDEKLKTPDAITKPTNTYVDELYEHGRDGHPAVCMSHHNAMMYCRWMQWRTGRRYRLPTEAEWEYACRAGTTTPYGFQDPADSLEDYAWFIKNSNTKDATDGTSAKADAEEPTTHQVAKKKPNAFGLYDLHGNVWEWCVDRYDEKAYSQLAMRGPTAGLFLKPLPDVKWGHVVRGGSFLDQADRLRSAARRASEPIWIKDDPQGLSSIWWLTNMDVIGFRVVLPVEEYPELGDLKPSLWKKPEPQEKGVRKRVKNG